MQAPILQLLKDSTSNDTLVLQVVNLHLFLTLVYENRSQQIVIQNIL